MVSLGRYQYAEPVRRNEYEISDRKEILKILARADVCRLALHDEPYPYIVPLNFGIEEGDPLRFYFHSAREGRKLELIRKNNKVCFEVDTDTKILSGEKACDWTMHYSSIIGVGTLEIIDEETRKKKGLQILMNHYAPGLDHEFGDSLLKRTLVLCLMVDSMSGKRHGKF